MDPLSRRDFVALAAAPALLQASLNGSGLGAQASPPAAQSRAGQMFVCMHEASSERFDFRTAMEGYAKAGSLDFPSQGMRT
jgi:hypothetical protein